MDDRELLELAAKAIDFDGHYVEQEYKEFNHKRYGIASKHINGTDVLWNPLENDSDAFRLAVKLGLAISVCKNMPCDDFTVILGIQIKELHGNESFSATRRAIVRAAAEIGKGKL